MHGGEGLDLLARVGLEEAHRVGELGDLIELHLRLHLLEACLELRELGRLVLPDAAGGPLQVRHLLPEQQRGRHLVRVRIRVRVRARARVITLT